MSESSSLGAVGDAMPQSDLVVPSSRRLWHVQRVLSASGQGAVSTAAAGPAALAAATGPTEKAADDRFGTTRGMPKWAFFEGASPATVAHAPTPRAPPPVDPPA